MTSPPGFVIDDDADSEEPPEEPAGFEEISTVEEATALLLMLKEQEAETKKEILFVENWIDNAVKESTIVQLGEKRYKTTPVRGTVTTVDAGKMERLVPDVAKRVIELVPKVNNDLLAKEIEKGNIPVDALKEFISQKPKKTSVRITEYTPTTEEDED